MKNFRTYDLAVEFYKECQRIKVKNAVIRDQFERASLSVVLNIAEGSGKLTAKDRRRFYARAKRQMVLGHSISLGSLRETQFLLQILDAKGALKLADQLGAYLYRLIQNPGGSS